MRPSTNLLTDYRWEDTATPDRHRTLQLVGDPALLLMGEKGLSRALGFALVRSLQNYLARAKARGHVAGEIGSLTTPCAWLLRLLDMAQTAAASEIEEAKKAAYEAGYEAGRRARERGQKSPASGGESDSGEESTNFPQTNHKVYTNGSTNPSTPHAGAHVSDQIRSDLMDSDSYINQSIQSDQINPSDQIGESENHLRIATSEGIPEGFAAMADDLRRDTEGWTEPELVEACRRMVAKGEKVKRPLWYLRTILKNLRAEWAQQQMVLLAQEKSLEKKLPRIREGDTPAPPFVGESPLKVPEYVAARQNLRAGGAQP